jgi:hypothetical protein
LYRFGGNGNTFLPAPLREKVHTFMIRGKREITGTRLPEPGLGKETLERFEEM